MPTITVRGVDDEVKAALAALARERGRSMEAEARAELVEAVGRRRPQYGLGSRIRARFAEIGGVDLDLPARSELARPAAFDG